MKKKYIHLFAEYARTCDTFDMTTISQCSENENEWFLFKIKIIYWILSLTTLATGLKFKKSPNQKLYQTHSVAMYCF